jgi:hypothetical protein
MFLRMHHNIKITKATLIPKNVKKKKVFLRRQGSHIFSGQSLTDGGTVVSLTRRLPFSPQKDS